jgi:hypothetical protein
VNLDFNHSYLPENVGYPVSVWDQMLTPESKQATPPP